MKNYAEEMLNFIDKSPTNFHCVNNVKGILLEEGFLELSQKEKWTLEKNKSYFVINEDTSLIAFKTGSGDVSNDGLNIIASHTDYPMVKIKPNAESIVENHIVKLNVEVYGGAILSSWFDRGLSIAGKVVLRDGKNIISKLINVNKTILTIPSLAIHLTRDGDDKKGINKQTDMQPIISFVTEELEKNDYISQVIISQLDCEKDDIMDFELFLYDTQKGEIFGLHDEFIQSRALDDLYMVYTSLSAFLATDALEKTNVLLLADNEEIGSNTSTGARSAFVENTLERLFISFGKNREEFLIGLSNTKCLSADLAHSHHPNYEGKSDPTNKPIIGKGIVIKNSANKLYASTIDTSSMYKLLLEEEKVPFQIFVIRSDIRGGSTIGPMLSQKFGVSALDVGASVLGMHSIRETGATKDVLNVINAFKVFYKN